ncbi:MAG: trehalase family glycosidase, partial [Gemmatimonadales bacterium]
GKMTEKYDVVDPNRRAGGGEYPNQDGFGWSNGVALALLAQERDARQVGAREEDEQVLPGASSPAANLSRLSSRAARGILPGNGSSSAEKTLRSRRMLRAPAKGDSQEVSCIDAPS